MSEAQPPKILIIDDEQGFRDAIHFEFGTRGYDVTPAASGQEGLRLAKEQVFDVVLCDRTMPGLDGLATLAALKDMHPKMPVIIVTGSPTEELHRECMQKEAFYCIKKPFEVEEIHQVIEQALGKRP